jgi:hypothetical protein
MVAFNSPPVNPEPLSYSAAAVLAILVVEQARNPGVRTAEAEVHRLLALSQALTGRGLLDSARAHREAAVYLQRAVARNPVLVVSTVAVPTEEVSGV